MRNTITLSLTVLFILSFGCEKPVPSELEPVAGKWTHTAPNKQVWEYDFRAEEVGFRIDSQKRTFKITKIRTEAKAVIVTVDDMGVKDIRIDKTSETAAMITSGLHKAKQFKKE